jgi:hypothetical protein
MITAADGLSWSPATYSAAKTLTEAFDPWVLVLLTDQPWPKTEAGGTSDLRSTLRPVSPAPPAGAAGSGAGAAGRGAGPAGTGAGPAGTGPGPAPAGAGVGPTGVSPAAAGGAGSPSAQIE